jgi:hypothetical protein
MFNNLITSEFKQVFRDSIDTLLAQNSLTVPCTIKYENTKRNTCYNCEFDPINQRSANRPKTTAAVNFPSNTICPVCNGFGFIDTATDEVVHLAIIFDSKYFLNWGSNTVNIPDGMVQSLCSISLLPKLREAKQLVMDNTLSNYAHFTYTRAGEPQPVGLGSNDYIITMWKKA